MGSLGGSNYIFPRFYRHAFVVAINSFDDSTLNLIFTSINDWHFSKGYADKVANLSRVCTQFFIATLLHTLCEYFPTCSHVFFNDIPVNSGAVELFFPRFAWSSFEEKISRKFCKLRKF